MHSTECWVVFCCFFYDCFNPINVNYLPPSLTHLSSARTPPPSTLFSLLINMDDNIDVREFSSEIRAQDIHSEPYCCDACFTSNPDEMTESMKKEKENLPPRLLLVSSRAKNIPAMTRAIRANVVMVQYKYENSTLDGILGLVAQALGTQKVETIGFVFHTSGSSIFLCAEGEKTVTAESIIEQISIREFFVTLASNHLDFSWVNVRLDFLGCTAADTIEGGLIGNEIETLFPTEVTVGISPDLIGTGVSLNRIGVEEEDNMNVGSLYFYLDKLVTPGGAVRSKLQQSTSGYEKIRVVGKGAFGAAVLYKRKDDESLVILKEINMHDLTSQERQLALNEVSVLSKLEHPNIVSYYDSFEEDGILMIEMEYADGGTLAQHLAKRERPLQEREILHFFQQMASAVRYLHENSVLHRDLKTANIFLTKENNIKVGDFGISKVMSTQTKQRGATTVLGTPYYISPEMCEGKPYDEKSDIWALGCILYEMACLQKTFEGSNLPALVNKIMKGQYEEVRGNYSNELKTLVAELLSKDPQNRPSAHDLLYHRILEMISRYDGVYPSDLNDEGGENISSTDSGNPGSGKGRFRSVLYTFDPSSQSLSILKDIPPKIRIRQMSVSDTHHLLVTTEKVVFGWGENKWGQLGVGDRIHRTSAVLLEALTGKSIVKSLAGYGFSLFCSDNGIVMTTGRADYVGQGHLEDDMLKPRLVDSLLSVDILDVDCGPYHSLAVGEGGKVFAWGKGEDGRLGTGSEKHEKTPILLDIGSSHVVRYVRCGLDGSMLITDAGTLLAMGSNEHNKLNLNQRQGFFSSLQLSKGEIDKINVPTPVKAFSSRVVDVNLGSNHGAALLESGQVYMFGANYLGQLGRGTQQDFFGGPVFVKNLAEKACVTIKCGEDQTLAVTSDYSFYYWGGRKIEDLRRLSNGTEESRATVESRLSEEPGIASSATSENGHSERGKTNGSAPRSEGSGAPNSATSSQSKGWNFRRKLRPLTSLDCVPYPQNFLKLESSRSASASSHPSIVFGFILCHGLESYINVLTAAPLPKQHSNKKIKTKTKGTLYQKVKGNGSVKNKYPAKNENEQEAFLSDNLDVENGDTKVPTWVKRELEDAGDSEEFFGEFLHTNKTTKTKKSNHSKNKSRRNSDSKRNGTVGIEEMNEKEIERELKETEMKDEIERLRQQLQMQQNHHQSQTDKMQALQKKLDVLEEEKKEKSKTEEEEEEEISVEREKVPQSRLCSIQ